MKRSQLTEKYLWIKFENNVGIDSYRWVEVTYINFKYHSLTRDLEYTLYIKENILAQLPKCSYIVFVSVP